MNLFNLSLRWSGYPIELAKHALQDIQNLSEARYVDYIHHQRSEIVKYHLKHNSFYSTFFSNTKACASDWKSIPILKKSNLQIPLAERLSAGYSLKNVHRHKTSGSTGTPFYFAKDKFCHALTWANIIHAFGQHGLDFNCSQQARFYGIPLDRTSYYKERIKDRLSKRYRFSVYDLSDLQMAKNIQIFKSKKFDYINGYSSTLVQLAKYLERRSIVLNTVCPSLKVCISTAELLNKTDKDLMTKQFGVPIVDEYGASELDLIAFHNPDGDWLVNSSTLFVEILDHHDQPLPFGHEGRVVITSLYNKAHPFIRYDIGDIAKLSLKSSLKTPILQTLMGRSSTIVTLPSGKTAAGLTFYYITKSIIEDDGVVKEFVIDQTHLNTFKITYVAHQDLTKDKISQVKNAMSRYLEPGLKLEFERKTVLNRSPNGKLTQFSSSINT